MKDNKKSPIEFLFLDFPNQRIDFGNLFIDFRKLEIEKQVVIQKIRKSYTEK